MENKRTLYFECYSGISGEMVVGSLLDLGIDKDLVIAGINSLPLSGFHVEVKKEMKRGIYGTAFQVFIDEPPKIDQQLCGEIESIEEIIQCSKLSNWCKKAAIDIFQIVISAEAKTYGIPVREVSFSQEKAVEAIVVIAGLVICLDELDIREIAVSTLYEGQGHTESQHGCIPVPVPTVLTIIHEYGLSIKINPMEGQMITPLGAAIVAYLKGKDPYALDGKIKEVGIGIGRKEFLHANVLRVMVIEKPDEVNDSFWMFEGEMNFCAEDTSCCVNFGKKG